jgi:hypothetical protein
MTNALDILTNLDQVRADTLARFDSLTQEQLDQQPVDETGNTGWSLGEVFMHIALDEHYLREQIARPLLEGVPPPESIHFIPPPPPYGAKKETIAFWFNRARTLTRRLLEDLPANINTELKHEGGLEPMNGLEWLAAYGGHEAFHHRQIDALMSQVAEAVA